MKKIIGEYGFVEIDEDNNVIRFERAKTNQGDVFKSQEAFDSENGDVPCYIPELHDVPVTRNDIINECLEELHDLDEYSEEGKKEKLCKGFENEEEWAKNMATYIFEEVDWQLTTSLIEERITSFANFEDEDEETENK